MPNENNSMQVDQFDANYNNNEINLNNNDNNNFQPSSLTSSSSSSTSTSSTSISSSPPQIQSKSIKKRQRYTVEYKKKMVGSPNLKRLCINGLKIYGKKAAVLAASVLKLKL